MRMAFAMAQHGELGFVLFAQKRTTKSMDEAKRFGTRIHFGDGRRRDVLEAAGARNARLIIVCVNNIETITATVSMIKRLYPDTPVLARARDLLHAIRLMQQDIDGIERETAEGVWH